MEAKNQNTKNCKGSFIISNYVLCSLHHLWLPLTQKTRLIMHSAKPKHQNNNILLNNNLAFGAFLEALVIIILAIFCFCRYGFVLLFMWLPAGFLIALFYKSTLLASLISVSYEKPMDTWQSLLDNDITLAIPTHLIQNELMYSSPRQIIK